MANKKVKGKKTTVEGGFSGIPRRVMDHPDWIGLGPSAKVLLQILAYQYRGKNNGDLSAAFKLVSRHGFKSKETLSNALTDLLERRMVVMTREGRFTNPGGVCSLYALAWEKIDPCPGKMITVSTGKAPRDFGRELVELNNKRPDTKTVESSPR